MRISFSTVFQVLALIVQDVLAFEAKQIESTNPPVTPVSQTPVNDSQLPIQ